MGLSEQRVQSTKGAPVGWLELRSPQARVSQGALHRGHPMQGGWSPRGVGLECSRCSAPAPLVQLLEL